MQTQIEPSDFHTYFRLVEQMEWSQYWKLRSSSKKRDKHGSMMLAITPLGDFIEIRHGSANQYVCTNTNVHIEKLKMAAELVRIEYFLKQNDLDSLIEEFKNSDSAIKQMMVRVPKSERFISFEAFAKAQDLARVIAANKAAVAALKY